MHGVGSLWSLACLYSQIGAAEEDQRADSWPQIWAEEVDHITALIKNIFKRHWLRLAETKLLQKSSVQAARLRYKFGVWLAHHPAVTESYLWTKPITSHVKVCDISQQRPRLPQKVHVNASAARGKLLVKKYHVSRQGDALTWGSWTKGQSVSQKKSRI